MSTNTYIRRLDAEDWVLIGYLIGVGLMWLIERFNTASTSDNGGPHSGQQVRLDERALERLEDGDSMKIPRWHGGDLVLRGDMVVTVPSESEDGEDDESER